MILTTDPHTGVESEYEMAELETKHEPRYATGWLIFAILGAAVAIWSFVRSGVSSDTVGYVVAAAGMFAAARKDYAVAKWPKFAAPILGLTAILIWILW